MSKQILQPIILAAILGLIGLFSAFAQQPWLLPSLGSASFVQIFEPTQPSAKPYSIAVGQCAGVVGAFAGLFLIHAIPTPPFTTDNPLVYSRVAAVVVAILIAATLQIATKAKSAAGGTIALLVGLGLEKPDWATVGQITVGIVLVTVLGEIGRRIVLRLP